MGTPAGSSSGSSPLPLSRRVAADDRDLLRRARWARQRHAQVLADVEFEAGGRPGRRSHAVRTRSGWRWKQDKKSFALYSRLRSGSGDVDGSPLSASMSLPAGEDAEAQQEASWTREWLAVGQVAGSAQDLALLLGSTSESDLNAAMKAIYRSSFIYGSVVHCGKPDADDGDAADGPLLVKTCSFVRAHLFARRNDELCFVEQLAPTPEAGGFTVAVCSLPARELAAGTASRAMVRELHPFSAYWSVQPAATRPPSVRVLLHVSLYSHEPVPSNTPAATAASSSRHAITRMSMLVKGVAARLEAVLDAGRRRGRLGTDPPVSLSVGGGSAAATAAGQPGGHRNSHCIACTRPLFSLFQATPWRRCELCAYLVCEGCCSLQRLPASDRLRVCLRCADSREFREYSSALRGSPRRHTVAVAMDSGGSFGFVLEDVSAQGGDAVNYRSEEPHDRPGEFSL